MTGDRSNLLAGIQNAGGIKALKKVDRSQVRDRSAAMVPGQESSVPAAPNPTSSGGGGLGDALAAALAQRNKKVSASGECSRILRGKLLTDSDDEDDGDDWD